MLIEDEQSFNGAHAFALSLLLIWTGMRGSRWRGAVRGGLEDDASAVRPCRWSRLFRPSRASTFDLANPTAWQSKSSPRPSRRRSSRTGRSSTTVRPVAWSVRLSYDCRLGQAGADLSRRQRNLCWPRRVHLHIRTFAIESAGSRHKTEQEHVWHGEQKGSHNNNERCVRRPWCIQMVCVSAGRATVWTGCMNNCRIETRAFGKRSHMIMQ